MKSIALFLVIIVCCTAHGVPGKSGAKPITKENGYYLGRTLGTILNSVQKALKSTGNNKANLLKCALGDLSSLVEQLSIERAVSTDALMGEMGLSVKRMSTVKNIMRDGAFSDGALSLELGETISELIEVISEILPLLAQIGMVRGHIVPPDTNVLDGLLGDEMLGGILNTVTGTLESVTSIVGSVTKPLSHIGGSVTGLLGNILGGATEVVHPAVNLVGSLTGAVTPLVGSLTSVLGNTVGTAANGPGAAVSDLVQGAEVCSP